MLKFKKKNNTIDFAEYLQPGKNLRNAIDFLIANNIQLSNLNGIYFKNPKSNTIYRLRNVNKNLSFFYDIELGDNVWEHLRGRDVSDILRSLIIIEPSA